MSADSAGGRHDVTPQTAIEAVRQHDGPLLLDLDETLYLRNSTEDFIDESRPRLPALVLLRALEIIRPWRWTGGDATRDVWRVRLILLLFPWTLGRWQRSVAGLAARFANLPLLAALRAPGAAPIIVTTGFTPIVLPLVAALGLPQVRVVSAGIDGFADRRDGKLGMALRVLGEETVRDSLVLTDSMQDQALLDACKRPLRAVWPDARYRRALCDVYLPGQYLSQVKRPGERYIVRGILQEDFAFWILSSIALAALPLGHFLGLLFLLASFWTIYERGYVDNDRIASRLESQPKLSRAFVDAPVATPAWNPWVWAAGYGALALVILRWPAAPALADVAAWTAVLLATHGWFTLYNRFDKQARVWLYPGLQVARSAAFAVLVPIVPIGATALGAHVLARWVPYFIYRVSGKDWPDAPVHLIRLLFFVVLAWMSALAQGPSFLLNGSAAALLAWNVFRARQEIFAAWGRARRLDGPRHGSSG